MWFHWVWLHGSSRSPLPPPLNPSRHPRAVAPTLQRPPFFFFLYIFFPPSPPSLSAVTPVCPLNSSTSGCSLIPVLALSFFPPRQRSVGSIGAAGGQMETRARPQTRTRPAPAFVVHSACFVEGNFSLHSPRLFKPHLRSAPLKHTDGASCSRPAFIFLHASCLAGAERRWAVWCSCAENNNDGVGRRLEGSEPESEEAGIMGLKPLTATDCSDRTSSSARPTGPLPLSTVCLVSTCCEQRSREITGPVSLILMQHLQAVTEGSASMGGEGQQRGQCQPIGGPSA